MSDETLRLAALQRVTDRRHEYQMWRIGFNKWVKEQRETQSADLRAKIAGAAQDAIDYGATIADVMRAYGTQDRRTVLNLLERRGDGSRASYTFNYTDAGTGHHPYVVHVERYGRNLLSGSIEFDVEGSTVFNDTADAGTVLGREINNPESDLAKAALEWVLLSQR